MIYLRFLQAMSEVLTITAVLSSASSRIRVQDVHVRILATNTIVAMIRSLNQHASLSRFNLSAQSPACANSLRVFHLLFTVVGGDFRQSR